MLKRLKHDIDLRLVAGHLAAALVLGMMFAATASAAPPASAIPTSTPPASRTGEVRQATHTAAVTTPGPRGEQPAGAGAAAGVTQAEQKLRLRGGDAEATQRRNTTSTGGRGIFTALASLAIVLGLFTAVVWVLRRGTPQVAGRLPREVVEVLGHATLGHRQQAQLVRLGKKLILINVTPSGAETLSEVTETAEVERLAALCRGSSAPTAPVSFRGVLEQFRQPTTGGTPRNASPLAASALPETAEGRRG